MRKEINESWMSFFKMRKMVDSKVKRRKGMRSERNAGILPAGGDHSTMSKR